MEESEPLLNSRSDKEITKAFKRRWWLLFIFSFSSFSQNIVWNTWGPIAQSAKNVFGWSDGQIGMFPNWGSIAFIVTVFPFSYFMDEKGLRSSTNICNALGFLASGIRCINSNPEYATWLMNIAAILNGIGGTVFNAGPALLASVWFPPGQRTTATAIASFAGYAGFAATFLLGPQLVADPIYNTTHEYVRHNNTTPMTTVTPVNRTELTNFKQLKDDIMRLMYYECGLAGIIFIATLLYFPNKPPSAPSYTATLSRVEYRKALGEVLRNGPLWLVCLACALPNGIYCAWGNVLDVILDPVGVKQKDAGFIGFYAILAGSIASLVVARFSDIFMRHMKLFLIVLYILTGGSFVWFTLLCNEMLTFSQGQLYASCILGGLFVNSCMPLFYEMTCETSYPVGEGITGAFLSLLINLSGVIFLFVLQIPNIGIAWMNWALLGSIGPGLIFLLIFPEKYGRTNLDIAIRSHTDMVIDIQDPRAITTSVRSQPLDGAVITS